MSKFPLLILFNKKLSVKVRAVAIQHKGYDMGEDSTTRTI